MNIDLLDGSIEKALHKSGHVMNWAVNKELLDEVLIGEYFNQPKAKANVLFQGISDQSYKIRKHTSFFRPDSNCHEKGNEEFHCFKLFIIGGGLKVKVWACILLVILIICDCHVFEYFVHLLDEVRIENSLAKPELFVFSQNHFMHAVGYLRHLAHLKALVYHMVLILLHHLFMTDVYGLGVVYQVIDLCVIIELYSVIDKNIGVLNLGFKLSHSLDYTLVNLTSVCCLHLSNIVIEVGIIASKSFFRNLGRIKLFDNSIVEFKPALF